MSFGRGKFGLFIFTIIGVALAISPAHANDSKKKTQVCSITINSTDEIDSFKKVFGDKDFEYTELTSGAEEVNSKRGSHWMRNACRLGVKCDVLIISGHFAESFFGASGLELPVEELERASCDATCDGVLQNPKEVFLMGCNTLAGKLPDSRTPEQYRQVLINDGFSLEDAEQVVAFRYSPLGDSFYDRMRRIFRGATRIYGFDSKGPLGAKARPLMTSYFSEAKAKKYYSSENFSKLDSGLNASLAKYFAGEALTQTEGMVGTRREQVPACFLQSSDVPFVKKLNWIQKSLNSKHAFQVLPAVNDFLASLENYQWPDKEYEILERVTYNSELRDRLFAVVKDADRATLGMQLKILTLMKFFGWVYPKDYMTRVEKLLLGDVQKDFSPARKDQICTHVRSNGLKVDLQLEGIPAQRWADPEFISIAGCISAYKPSLYGRILDLYLGSKPGTPMYQAALESLHEFNLPKQDGQNALARVFGNAQGPITNHQWDFSCSDYNDRRPRMSVNEVNSSRVNDVRYIEALGCFAKPQLALVRSLLGLLKVKDKTQAARQKAIISVFTRWTSSTVPLEIDGETAAELFKIAKQERNSNERIATAAVAMLTIAEKIPQSITKEIFAEMESLIAREGVLALSTWSDIFVQSPIREKDYCGWLVRTSRNALNEQRPLLALNLVDSGLDRCGSLFEASKIYSQILKTVATSEIPLEDPIEETAYPYRMLDALVDKQVQITDWQDVWAALVLRDFIEGEPSGALSGESIVKLMSGAGLKTAIVNSYVTAPVPTKKKMLKVLASFDAKSPVITAVLQQQLIGFDRQFASGEIVKALMRQDSGLGLTTYVEALSAAGRAGKDGGIIEAILSLGKTNAVSSALRTVLEDKKISDKYKIALIKKASEVAPTYYEFAHFVDELSTLARAPGYSKAVKSELARAARTVQENNSFDED